LTHPRQAFYWYAIGTILFLGLEVAGEVAQTGAIATDWPVGDKVCALTNGVARDMLHGLGQFYDRAALKTRQSLLVHGSSSGIGTIGIQMAKAWRARVFIYRPIASAVGAWEISTILKKAKAVNSGL
jgi:NADPH:quinone reductase